MKIWEKIKVAAVALTVALSGLALVGTPVWADDDCAGKTGTEATKCYAELAGEGSGHTDGLFSILQTILNVVFGIIGFIAVIMLVYGGIQYTISSGDAGKVKKAKDTILYGIVGLIISLLAAAIVNFVLANMLS